MIPCPSITYDVRCPYDSKYTKLFFLIAIVCIGSAQVWQHYSQRTFDKSHHILYDLDLKTGVWRTNAPHVPLLRTVLGLVGTLAFLLALPLLINDITHGGNTTKSGTN
jgi:steroid 5-alpha reductase family enzyme